MAVTAIFRHVVVIAFVEAKNLLRNAIESAIESYVKKKRLALLYWLDGLFASGKIPLPQKSLTDITHPLKHNLKIKLFFVVVFHLILMKLGEFVL